jgi:O-antigen ligase
MTGIIFLLAGILSVLGLSFQQLSKFWKLKLHVAAIHGVFLTFVVLVFLSWIMVSSPASMKVVIFFIIMCVFPMLASLLISEIQTIKNLIYLIVFFSLIYVLIVFNSLVSYSGPQFDLYLGSLGIGVSMAISIIVLVILMSSHQIHSVHFFLLLCLAAFILYTLFMSASRGPTYFLFFSLLIYFFIFHKRKISHKLLIAILASFLIFLSVKIIPERPIRRIAPSNLLNTKRYYRIKSAIDCFGQAPFLGIGIGNYDEYYDKYSPNPATISVYSFLYPHNAPVEVLSVLGLSGFACYLIFLGWIFYCVFKILKDTNSPDYKLAHISATIFIFLFLESLVSYSIFNFYAFWLFSGIVIRLYLRLRLLRTPKCKGFFRKRRGMSAKHFSNV